MTAQILTAPFGKSAQNRNHGFAPDLKSMSEIVAEMSAKHAMIRAKGDWRSIVSGEPHRFVIFTYRSEPEYMCLGEMAAPSIEAVNKILKEVDDFAPESLLAVTCLNEPFEAQWPRERAGDSLEALIQNPQDLRYKEAAQVVIELHRA